MQALQHAQETAHLAYGQPVRRYRARTVWGLWG
jgi:hypothetical protein